MDRTPKGAPRKVERQIRPILRAFAVQRYAETATRRSHRAPFLNVRKGSKAEELKASTTSPLHPLGADVRQTLRWAALGQKGSSGLRDH
jgi:hypothetical protein